MIEYLVIAGYSLSVPGYLALAVLAATVRRDVSLHARRSVVLACLATAVWAGVSAAALLGVSALGIVWTLAGIIRTFAWLNVLARILEVQEPKVLPAGRRLLKGRMLFVGLIAVALPSVLGAVPDLAPVSSTLTSLTLAGPLIASVAGLVMAEKVFVRSGLSGRWGLKYLVLSLVTIFGFDLYLFADALLLNILTLNILEARGLVATMLVPLLAISILRMKSWVQDGAPNLNASRATALHGVALLGSGLYLLTMAAIAFFVRETGGEWGNTLQITFLVGGFVVMFAVLGSGRFVSQVKIYVQKAFFTYSYDYREEWRRFIAMMSAHQTLTLGERIVHTIANTMDSPSGALWVWQAADGAYIANAAWNYHGARPSEKGDSPFVEALYQRGWIVEVASTAAGPICNPAIDLPPWLADRAETWLVVPLAHRNEMLGFLVLDRARAPRRLDWEDRDLLKTVAAHASSYLAEELAANALDEAQKFEDFNRRFAFVAHDIKNIVGQMSLIVGNAERFGDNPDFQRDMLETVRNSTDRMKALLDQLTEKRRRPEKAMSLATVDLEPLVAETAERWRKTNARVRAEIVSGPCPVRGNSDSLVAVLDHLIDNALESIGPAGRVEIGLRRVGDGIGIEVKDNGSGMDPDFARNELFRPMHSTKAGGYGIGAFQTRHVIREMGGRLEVDTAPNRGTTMRILFPVAADDRPRMAQDRCRKVPMA